MLGMRALATLSAVVMCGAWCCGSNVAVVVEVAPHQVTLSPNGQHGFTADVRGTTDKTVLWTVREAAHGGGFVSEDGVYTAPATPGTYHVVATSFADQKRSSSAVVVVEPAAKPAAPAAVSSAAASSSDVPRRSHTGVWVSGYYAGYFWGDYPPERVDMSTMTHAIFARIFPGAGQAGGAPGSIVAGAASAQVGIPGATGIAYEGARSVEDFFVARAHAAGIKALAVIGGNGDGEGFARSTATAELRQRFAKAIVDYLVANDYDGIDLDWEDNLNPSTYAQVYELLDALRSEANGRARYRAPRAPVLITFPGYVLNSSDDDDYPKAAAWRVEIAKRVDQYNLMSYGMCYVYDGWFTWYFSPLRNNARRANHPLDVESSFDAYVAAGVPKSKLGVGIGLFGSNFAAHPTCQPHQTYKIGDFCVRGTSVYRSANSGTSGSGPSGTAGAIRDGSVEWRYVGEMAPDQPVDVSVGLRGSEYDFTYAKVYRWLKQGLGTRHFDAQSGATYAVFPDGLSVPGSPPGGDRLGYLTYEDDESIAAKGKWVRDNGYGGAIVWMINYGVVDENSGANPAMQAVKRAFLE